MPESPIQSILSAIANTKAIPADSEHLVDGRLIVSSVIHQKLREMATAEIGEVARGPIFGIPVVEIPDDGEPHDIGGGKVAVVSPLDHVSVWVMPAELVSGTVDVPADWERFVTDDQGGSYTLGHQPGLF